MNKLKTLSLLCLFNALSINATLLQAQSTHSFTTCTFPDTGQTLCYNGTAQSACPVSGFPRQDGDYSGSQNNPKYTINCISGSSVTVDNRTGLMWITNPTDASMGGTYTWDAATAACEGSSYAGYSDWRMPNAIEQLSIMHFGAGVAPFINTVYFYNTASDQYWTSTSRADSTANAIVTQFAYMSAGYLNKTSSKYIRCVRGPGMAGAHSLNSGINCPVQKLPDTNQSLCHDASGTEISCTNAGVDASYAGTARSYTLNGSAPDQTTTDNITGLMWATNGSGSGGNNGNTATWAQALIHCSTLTLAGYTNWRLPNAKEIYSILDFSRISAPFIDTTYFPNTQAAEYWTGTTDRTVSLNNAKYLYFVSLPGYLTATTKTTYLYLRCVRNLF